MEEQSGTSFVMKAVETPAKMPVTLRVGTNHCATDLLCLSAPHRTAQKASLGHATFTARRLQPFGVSVGKPHGRGKATNAMLGVRYGLGTMTLLVSVPITVELITQTREIQTLCGLE